MFNKHWKLNTYWRYEISEIYPPDQSQKCRRSINSEATELPTESNSKENEIEQNGIEPMTRVEERKKDFDVNQETRNATIVEVSENPYYEGVRMSQVISI